METVRPDARAWFAERTTTATSLADLDPAALLHAKRRGVHRISVVLPARNGPDLDDVPESVLADLDVHLVTDVRDVLELALEPA